MTDVFVAHLKWTGFSKEPTGDPMAFSRDLELGVADLTVPMSSAPSYRGDSTRANPEQMYVGALSACQALTYLFLAAKHKITVVAYEDSAEGQLALSDGRVRMTRVTLRPRITLAQGGDEAKARDLVDRAHRDCFIANSVSATVEIEPRIMTSPAEPRAS